MKTVRMQHPNLAIEPIDVPESAVTEHARAGWQVAAGEAIPACEACGQPLPVAKAEPPPEQAEKSSEAPAESEAPASKGTPRRRRSSSEESE